MWFDAIIKTTKLWPREEHSATMLSEFFDLNLASVGDKFNLTGIPNLKEHFKDSSWGLISSFADTLPEDEDTVLFHKSRFRLDFTGKYTSAYLMLVGAAHRVIRMSNPGMTEGLASTMAQLTWAKPGNGVEEHVDSKLGYKLSHRAHIPIRGRSTVYMRGNDYTLHSEPGTAYYLNNRVPHKYINETNDFNVFLTLDFVEVSKYKSFPKKAFGIPDWPTLASGEPSTVSETHVNLDSQ